MAKKKADPRQLRDAIKQMNDAHERNIELAEEEARSLDNIFDIHNKIALKTQQISDRKEIILNFERVLNEAIKQGYTIHGNTLNALKKQQDELKNVNKRAKQRLAINKAIVASAKALNDLFLSTNGAIRNYLMDADGAIKSLNLELGFSGERAAQMRENFEDSAQYAARLGVSVGQLAQMQSVYADETGRARALSEESLEAISQIAKGTALGVEQSARLAGQFELLGLNAEASAEKVQSIVDSTERMGVNTLKVMNKISKNFRELAKYNFRNGVEGFADMASYAEKFKINMDEVFEPLERGRRLDSVIEMSAELQVLGGQFANLADPMSVLFESRNDPKAFMKRLNEMTKGMATLKETSDGFSFELASPMARDMLDKAAQSLGMSTEELTTQALRMREIQEMRQQMATTGLGGSEKEIVEGLAQFDTKTGKFFVQLGNARKEISMLAKQDIKALKTQSQTLEERAIAAQTFDQAFENTVMELKATLLPLLNGINDMLQIVRPIVTKTTDFIGDLLQGADKWYEVGGMLLGAGMLFKGVVGPLTSLVPNLLKAGSTKLLNTGGGATKSITSKAPSAGGKSKGGMGAGAGIGLAAVGTGAGIMMAAEGMSSLADSMSKLDKDQVEALKTIGTTLAITFPAAAVGILAVGAASSTAVAPILALGAAVLGIGAGIGIASAGIGYMAESFGDLLQTADPSSVMAMAAGMTSLAGASMLFANPLSMVGLAAMAGSVSSMAAAGPGMEKVGNAFQNIGAVLQGSSSQLKEVRDTIQAISNTEVGNNNAISNLVSILSKPLQVEFKDKDIGFVANIDLNMNGERMFEKMNISRKVEIKQIDYQSGKASPRST